MPFLNQQKQCDNLRLVVSENSNLKGTRGKIRTDVTSKDQYIAQRARGAYVATVGQPEASYHLSVAARVIKPKQNDAKKLNKTSCLYSFREFASIGTTIRCHERSRIS
ncbi:hypothetical protein EAF04_007346 [Stromatinia cepivora]|nr:hypothetical protein EAF04_007346 [Stromatinia cepivora]